MRLGITPLGVSMRMVPDMFNIGGKTHLNCELHHPMGWSPELKKKEVES